VSLSVADIMVAIERHGDIQTDIHRQTDVHRDIMVAILVMPLAVYVEVSECSSRNC